MPAPRTPLTRERVLRAGLVIADRDGLDGLTMRALGAAVGVQAMSLYNHVTDKDDILGGLVDLVVAEIGVSWADAPWREAMRQRAEAAHRVLLAHPWATGLLMSRANVGPAMLTYIDRTLGCLTRAGFSLPMADHVWNTLDGYIYGFTLYKLNFPFQPSQYAAMAAMFLPQVPADRYPTMHALTVEVAAGRHDGLHELGFGLDLLLDGLDGLTRRGELPPG